MTLPRLLVLTDRRACPRPLVDVVRAAVQGGARAVLLREKDLPAPERLRLAAALQRVLDDAGALLVLAGTALPAPALHLAAADPVPDERPALLGRSCHNPREVAAARHEGCDWVTLSPVHLTASKPGHGPALGYAGLARLAREAPPAYALGGVGPDEVGGCLAAGAYGVAVMGAVMRSRRPDAVVGELLAALGAAA